MYCDIWLYDAKEAHVLWHISKKQLNLLSWWYKRENNELHNIYTYIYSYSMQETVTQAGSVHAARMVRDSSSHPGFFQREISAGGTRWYGLRLWGAQNLRTQDAEGHAERSVTLWRQGMTATLFTPSSCGAAMKRTSQARRGKENSRACRARQSQMSTA